MGWQSGTIENLICSIFPFTWFFFLRHIQYGRRRPVKFNVSQETNYLWRKKQANEHNDQKHLDLCVFSIITSKAECYIIIIFCYDSVTVWIKTSKYLHYFVEWMLLLIKSLWKSFWLELTWTRWPFTVAITDILFMYSYM